MILPYLVGVATAPLVAKIVKPLVRGGIKTTIGAALQVKKLAAEAVEDVQDLAAEAAADFVATEAQPVSSATVPRAGARAGGSTALSKKV